MTGDLVVVQTNQPVQLYSARNMDYDALEKRLEEEEASFSRFPGDGLTHDGKKGQWMWGYGKKGVVFDHKQYSFVMNLPNAVEGWRKWVDKKCVYGPVVMLCSGDKLPERKEMGDSDPTLWETVSGKPKDPWERYIAVPIRIDGQDSVQHLFVKAFWTRIKFMDLMRDFAKQGRQNFGKLPVVNIGNETRNVKDSKTETFEVGTFEIVAWDDPIAADLPEGIEAQLASQTPIPEATATVTQRKDTPAEIVTKLANPDATTVQKLQAEQDDKVLFPGMEADKAHIQVVTAPPATPAPTEGRRRGAPTPVQTAAPVGELFVGGGSGRRRTAVKV